MEGKGYNKEVEARKRKRESLIIFVVALLIVLITYIETYISQITTTLPVSSNVLIFGLININIILLILLIFLILRNFIKLFFDRRSGVLGSKLRTKLVLAFVALTIVPTFLLFFIATGFITKSIESWFGMGIEEPLQESLEVAQTFYKEIARRNLHLASSMAMDIAGSKGFKGLERYIKDIGKDGLTRVEVFDNKGERVMYWVSEDTGANTVADAEKAVVDKGLQGEGFVSIDSTPDGDVIRAIVPIVSRSSPEEVKGVVVLSQHISTPLMKKLQAISNAVKEYRQFKLLKGPIKTSYFIILLIITLVIVFLSTWIGFHIAKGITVPIQSLAEGTQAISTGNLDYRIEGGDFDDEIGILVRSFNKMTEDLKRAYTELKRTNVELDQRRRYMETVLKNVAAGVVSIDKTGRITTINKVAEEMLGLDTKNIIGRHYREVMKQEHLKILREMIREISRSSSDSIEKELKLDVKGKKLTVLVNLTLLKDEYNSYLGMVAVFDDLTHLLKVQRMMAWKEVARRIAHEIKNPLTPIKLSAQRLRKRYGDHLAGNDGVFDQCTRTIIRQVDELKALVDEFSNFARMPAANPEPNDVNEVIREAVALYESAHRDIEFQFIPGRDVPIIEIDRDQIKRAIINLLENSVESMEVQTLPVKENGRGEIRVETSFDPVAKVVRIDLSDTGCGIPPEDREKLFEPYFSTKKSGTGLGLAIVNNIIADHNGYIRVMENRPKGTRFVIELPVRA